MKYYSKSPEEWKKEDEKKGWFEKTAALKRRAWIFLFINILLVFGVFIMVGIYTGGSGLNLPFFQSRNRLPGPIQIYIKFKETGETFRLGEPLDIRVYAQNTERFSEDITIQNFSFVIENSVGEAVYVFNYPSKVVKKLEKFEVVLLFDLKKEKILNDLKKGEYTVKVSMRLNNRDVTIAKNFTVEEVYEVVVEGFQPFYFTGEIPYFKIGMKNLNLKDVKVFLKTISFNVENENGMKIETKKYKVNQEYYLPKESAIEIIQVEPKLKFDKLGLYRFTVNLLTDKGEYDFNRSFVVINKEKLSIKNLGVFIESPINVTVNEIFDVKVYLYNSDASDKYTLIKNASFVVTGNGEVSTDTLTDLRLWFTKNEKILVFEKELSFDHPGEYKILVLFKTDLGNIYKELKLYVGGVEK